MESLKQLIACSEMLRDSKESTSLLKESIEKHLKGGPGFFFFFFSQKNFK